MTTQSSDVNVTRELRIVRETSCRLPTTQSCATCVYARNRLPLPIRGVAAVLRSAGVDRHELAKDVVVADRGRRRLAAVFAVLRDLADRRELEYAVARRRDACGRSMTTCGPRWSPRLPARRRRRSNTGRPRRRRRARPSGRRAPSRWIARHRQSPSAIRPACASPPSGSPRRRSRRRPCARTANLPMPRTMRCTSDSRMQLVARAHLAAEARIVDPGEENERSVARRAAGDLLAPESTRAAQAPRSRARPASPDSPGKWPTK